MLYLFTRLPAEALDLPGGSMQGNKVPVGHSNLVRAACLDPSGCCWQTQPSACLFVQEGGLHIPLALLDLPPSTHWQGKGIRASLPPSALLLVESLWK